jgi:hypothetical protein
LASLALPKRRRSFHWRRPCFCQTELASSLGLLRPRFINRRRLALQPPSSDPRLLFSTPAFCLACSRSR